MRKIITLNSTCEKSRILTEAETTAPNKIIKVANDQRSVSVEAECIVGNKKDKKHKLRALSVDWSPEKARKAKGKGLNMMRSP